MSILTVVAESGGAASLDMGLVEQLVGLIKSMMGLFTVYPLNIMLIGGFAGLAFGVIIKGKRAAK